MSTPNLAITHILASQLSKDATANTAFDEFDGTLTDMLTVTMADSNQTVATSDALYHIVFKCTGALTAGRNLVVPTNKKLYVVLNATTGGFAITVKTPSGTGIAVLATASYVVLYCDGTNVVAITTGSVPAASTFTSLTDVPASYSGAGGEAVEVNAGATGLQFSAKPFDVPIFVGGTYTNSQVLYAVPLGRSVTFKAGLASSSALLGTAATGSTVFSLKKNGTQFGTVTFAASGTVGTFAAASDTTFSSGDILSIVAPASADATAASLGMTLVGIRN